MVFSEQNYYDKQAYDIIIVETAYLGRSLMLILVIIVETVFLGRSLTLIPVIIVEIVFLGRSLMLIPVSIMETVPETITDVDPGQYR